MHQIKAIIQHLEQAAPLAYQEDYDNAGLVVGDATKNVTGVLISVDITEAVLREAQAKQCNLIIAHHPLIFKPIYQLSGEGHVTRCLTYAIKNDLAIYVLHTNLDNIASGVNQQLGQNIGLQDLSILLPRKNTLAQMATFVPASATESVLQALHTAGAGRVGAYTHCSFATPGLGTFRPTEAAHPHIGASNKLERVEETRIEVVFPLFLEQQVVAALQAAHPYEEVAYQVTPLRNVDTQVGTGMIGRLPQALESAAFLKHLKACLSLACIRHTTPLLRPIKRVAVCGGSGSFLIQEALRQGADALVTSDVKYHDFFGAEERLLIADVGHYESEVGTKELIYTLLFEKFANIALFKCESITNPVHYF